jgi:hypothetical protein
MELLGKGDERPGILRELAAIHAGLGQPDRAHAWMERAVDAGWRLERSHPSPLLAPYWEEPRFRRLRDRIEREIRADGMKARGLGLIRPARPS